ncbi:hypothetical protein LY90DRAFT_498484 [Neocallimastix californiae]|uniref:BZIP domain-containing protein n=1 Tax=Neocallimastix californiae TaxID=1754190 RepID=A0A1Y2FUI2_9FUNG|nr:hypothetical protein LY90DRAFT_498484 [Neocallimastix californiae]|eukprot:ORY87227.1 hypothetical protein LY90DRAFT_498484 [Neocallimastix californiae]
MNQILLLNQLTNIPTTLGTTTSNPLETLTFQNYSLPLANNYQLTKTTTDTTTSNLSKFDSDSFSNYINFDNKIDNEDSLQPNATIASSSITSITPTTTISNSSFNTEKLTPNISTFNMVSSAEKVTSLPEKSKTLLTTSTPAISPNITSTNKIIPPLKKERTLVEETVVVSTKIENENEQVLLKDSAKHPSSIQIDEETKASVSINKKDKNEFNKIDPLSMQYINKNENNDQNKIEDANKTMIENNYKQSDTNSKMNLINNMEKTILLSQTMNKDKNQYSGMDHIKLPVSNLSFENSTRKTEISYPSLSHPLNSTQPSKYSNNSVKKNLSKTTAASMVHSVPSSILTTLSSTPSLPSSSTIPVVQPILKSKIKSEFEPDIKKKIKTEVTESSGSNSNLNMKKSISVPSSTTVLTLPSSTALESTSNSTSTPTSTSTSTSALTSLLTTSTTASISTPKSTLFSTLSTSSPLLKSSSITLESLSNLNMDFDDIPKSSELSSIMPILKSNVAKSCLNLLKETKASSSSSLSSISSNSTSTPTPYKKVIPAVTKSFSTPIPGQSTKEIRPLPSIQKYPVLKPKYPSSSVSTPFVLSLLNQIHGKSPLLPLENLDLKLKKISSLNSMIDPQKSTITATPTMATTLPTNNLPSVKKGESQKVKKEPINYTHLNCNLSKLSSITPLFQSPISLLNTSSASTTANSITKGLNLSWTAHLSRKRKREQLHKLEVHAQELISENQQLKEKVIELEKSNISYQNEIKELKGKYDLLRNILISSSTSNSTSTSSSPSSSISTSSSSPSSSSDSTLISIPSSLLSEVTSKLNFSSPPLPSSSSSSTQTLAQLTQSTTINTVTNNNNNNNNNSINKNKSINNNISFNHKDSQNNDKSPHITTESNNNVDIMLTIK